ncbi:hypothetical protein [Hymenobacter sp. IS2118]|uniref:hypothetical protein n=1 Tax=Hymenobacter sp. IS2118 TaxID=1505605 RepID=UPI00126966D2|nr:hypothetical protein [Hymenobacter sp. IS2118]
MLLQTLGREVLVLDYQLNKVRITELYCVNKARPKLHCNGKCYLMQQLRQADSSDKKAPAGTTAKVKYEVLPQAAFRFVAGPLARRALEAGRYPVLVLARAAAVPETGVFRPPLA